MTDHSRIPLAGVIGHPVAHSRSPTLHGFWLKRYGLKGHYVPLDVAPSDFETTLKTLPKMGFVGVNVTLPHKENLLRIADSVTDRAALIGAANTVVFGKDGKIHADNTDGLGFIANLRQSSPEWIPADGPAAVFGAGGAARAVLASLLEAGVPEVRISNRTRSRAETLQNDFGPKVVVYDWAEAHHMLLGATTVVNTTSLGMTGKTEFAIPLDTLTPGVLATDVVYTPLKTAFLAQAEARGAKVVDGLGMLLHQAVSGFECWFGHRPDVDAETREVVLST